MTKRAINFSAGPAILPLSVLEEARRDLVDYQGTGMSVMEMSHRSPAYDEIHLGAVATLRRLLQAEDEHDILFLQGGASLQFSMVPMNLMFQARRADYVDTGAWSAKAIAEAGKVGEVRIAGSSREESYTRIPRQNELDLDPSADYIHITTNNTIYGTEWDYIPETGSVPLVADVSSDIMSKPIDMTRFGLIYAGAQKNLGPAGVSLVVIRKDVQDRAPKTIGSMLRYRTHAEKGSLYNTPACWAIYIVGLVARWVEGQGGLDSMQRANEEKAGFIYDILDQEAFYRGTARRESRSLMNIPFRLPTEELERRFVAEASAEGMTNLKGHRSVGGIRASIYNAMPRSGVETLVAFMQEFERKHG
ncbi:MAG: 3-phosphoserine/phosphohydroxythreonine aminotransferase [Gemmatimonadetes bacterium]|nr:3-phosphoserine/phosphohydroxythreonine aminotransferase [Gemmatimonadota bacterium]